MIYIRCDVMVCTCLVKEGGQFATVDSMQDGGEDGPCSAELIPGDPANTNGRKCNDRNTHLK